MTKTLVLEAVPVSAQTGKPVKVAKTKTHSAFSVISKEDGEKYVEIKNEKLIGALRDCTREIENLYDRSPVVSIANLFYELAGLEHELEYNNRTPGLRDLIQVIKLENQHYLDQVTNMVTRGVVNFAGLRMLLTQGREIVVRGKHLQGARVLDVNYRSNFFGAYLEVEYEYITATGTNFVIARDTTQIEAFKGVKDINTLNVTLLTDQQKRELTERGTAYEKLAVGSHYKHMTGHMEVKKWWYWTPMRATGRIMVDLHTFDQFQDGGRMRRDAENSNLVTIPQDQLWMTDPYVQGFSFVAKQWGRFAVSDISDIEFRSQAYDQLVMDPDQKAMIRALVEDNSSGFSDIISGKGGGCIFLLHGEPGVGKTLTAESVSELLKRPLYSVSVGELGTDTVSLEKSLRMILDVAQIWNAVILIDEADVFLEKRGDDIMRNAMCGIFLRLLEYHQGVMFLTTNRVKQFDSAFHSRISVALRFGALSQEARASIWTNLLAAANIQGLDPMELAQVEVNGRQIKNTIRLAQSLARQEGVNVTRSHVQRCLDVAHQFSRDLAG